jgi:hypothetical protein
MEVVAGRGGDFVVDWTGGEICWSWADKIGRDLMVELELLLSTVNVLLPLEVEYFCSSLKEECIELK